VNFQERRQRKGPIFKTHQKSHEAVLANEFWFGDGSPIVGKQFTAAKSKERKAKIIDLLFRAARRDRRGGHAEIADRLETLADKIFYCCPARRCGSLACTHCIRAFQKAKVAAQEFAIDLLKTTRKGKLLVMVTVVPLWITYTPEELANLDVRNLNRWLKDNLARVGFKRVMLGSIDFSWEAKRGIYQPHWHIAMWTSNRDQLTRRLKRVFTGLERGDRPVEASKTYSLGFLPYKNKAIKLPSLLRNNRRGLPYLLLALDRTEPLELMVLSGIRVSAQDGGLEFKKIQRRKMAGHRKRRIDEKR
jgi:hypothetical protein